MSKRSFCTQPGSAYPWAPLRRYIFENQGSLKRMYGEFRQSNIVQEEIDRFTARYEMFDAHGFTEFEIRRAKAAQEFIVDSGEGLRESHKSTFHFPSSSPLTSTSLPASEFVTSVPSSVSTTTASTTTSTTTTPKPVTTTTTQPTTEKQEYETQPEVTETILQDENDEDDSETSTHVLNFEDDLSSRDELPLEPLDNTLTGQAETPKEEVKGYPACPITQEVVAPYWANNTRGETLALLNVYPFEQYIHWEKCAHEGEQMFCREGCKCEQQYRLHRLLAFDPKSECRGIFADWFRFPGSCACVCYDSLPDRINSRKARL